MQEDAKELEPGSLEKIIEGLEPVSEEAAKPAYRFAVIYEGFVQNVIRAPEDFVLPNCTMVQITDSTPCEGGWLYKDGVFSPPPSDETL